MVTIEQVLGLLREEGILLHYQMPSDPDRLAIPMPSRGRFTWVVLSVEENGEYVRLHVPGMAALPRKGKKVRMAVLTALMAENQKKKLVKFGLDPSDGELDAEIGIPVEDGEFTKEMLSRSMRTLLNGVTNALLAIDRAKYGDKAMQRAGVGPAVRGPGVMPDLATLMAEFEEAERARLAAATPEASVEPDVALDLVDDDLDESLLGFLDDEDLEPVGEEGSDGDGESDGDDGSESDGDGDGGGDGGDDGGDEPTVE